NLQGAPACGALAMRSRVDVTAFSQRCANFELACTWYQSACSRTSAIARSLNVSRGVCTGKQRLLQAGQAPLFILANQLPDIFAGSAPVSRGNLTFHIGLKRFG